MTKGKGLCVENSVEPSELVRVKPNSKEKGSFQGSTLHVPLSG